MRKLALACVLALLATVQGCGGGDGGGPTAPQPRGNWVGTISGTHADLRIQGTCTLEVSFDPNFNGLWWIDCPGGASSQGQVFAFLLGNETVFTFFNVIPASSCPWIGFATHTATLINGDFEVTDCTTNAVRSRGTLQIRPR